MSDDIAAFIRARLGEAEAHARKDLWMIERATPGEKWTVAYGYNLPYSLLGEDGSIGRITSSRGKPLADGEKDLHQADAMLVGRLVRRAARDASRVLREVEAKRALLALHRHLRFAAPLDVNSKFEEDRRPALAEAPRYVGCEVCSYDSRYEEVYPSWWCDHIRLLALPYADHPDYREEWRP